jgi:uncharacterized protein (TIGR02145 family)
MVPANGDSLTVRLYASYISSDDKNRYAYLEIRVEDGTCICPAKKDANTWLNFMCHNLGGLDIISSSQLITYEHHGNWYRFGVKNLSVVNTGTNNGAADNWNSLPYSTSGDWPDNDANPAYGNPCPAGWRLPDTGELGAIINRDADNNTLATINLLTNVPASWLGGGTFSNLKKSGDYLYLPITGIRSGDDGALYNRGIRSDYWSSKGNTSYGCALEFNSNNTNINKVLGRLSGFPVRCIEAE